MRQSHHVLSDTDPSPARSASWWWLSLVIAGMAAWMSLGRLHYVQDADSLVPVLVSLQHWTPFYWEQDRFGMLVPLIVRPVHHPLANLLLQGWMTTTAALLAPFLVARYMAGKTAVSAVAAGALANALLFLVVDRQFQFDWLITQPYALSISLAVGGLLLLESRAAAVGVAAALILLLLAHWVSSMVFLFLLPLVLLRRRSIAWPLGMIAIAAAGGLLCKRFAAGNATGLGVVRFSQWPAGWLHLLQTTSTRLIHPVWLIVFAVIVTAAIVRWTDRPAREVMMTAAATAMTGVLYWGIVGTSQHVQENDYFPRYVLPALLLFGVAFAMVLLAPLRRHHRMAAALAVVLMIASAVDVYRAPSLARLRRELDRRLGAMTADVLATGATVIVGDYWVVWPAVYHANLVQYERTGRGGIFGLTYRSGPTEAFWRSARPLRVLLAAPPRAENSDPLQQRLGVPVRFLEHRATLDLFVAASPTS